MSGGGESGEPAQSGKRLTGRGALPRAYDVALRWALTLAVAVLVGFFAGRWLDGKLHTTPLFILIGLFWGIAGSFLSLFLQLRKIQENEDRPSK